MSVVEVKGLYKSLGKKEILRNMSFEIGEREIVGFIGPNGAGKSTTMKCLTSLLKPDKGTITICGHDLMKEREKALENVSAMIENPGLFPTLNGYENLLYFAKLRHIPQERIDEMVAFTKLGPHIKKRTAYYSMGMKQRLGLAIALLNNPKFLILDEPTNGLDPNGIMELRKELRELVEHQGISILISSHQLGEIDKIADRTICIHHGQIIEPPKAIQDYYAYTFILDEKDLEKAKDITMEGAGFEWKTNSVDVHFDREEGMHNYLAKLMEKGIIVRDIIKESLDIEKVYQELYQEDL